MYTQPLQLGSISPPSPMERSFGVRKGAWTEEEDNILKKCIEKYGEGNWHKIPHRAGLNRCRKSCRLRWVNYLGPNIKRGEFTSDEVDLIIRMHKLLGNRWSLIAGRIPGRTANDIKNYWNTHLRKKLSSCNNLKPEIISLKTKAIKPHPWNLSKNSQWSRIISNCTETAQSAKLPDRSPTELPEDQGEQCWKNITFDGGGEIGTSCSVMDFGEVPIPSFCREGLELHTNRGNNFIEEGIQNDWDDLWGLLDPQNEIMM